MKKNFQAYLLILLALSLTYLPAFTGYYGHHDSYCHFWGWERDEFDTQQDYLEFKFLRTWPSGRFLEALIFAPIRSNVDSIPDLNIIRYLTVLSLSLCAFICFHIINKYFQKKVLSILFSILIFTLPSFQVFVFSDHMLIYAFGLIAALLAAMAVCRVSSVNTLGRNLFYLIVAAVLFLFSLMVYQPSAMFYWVIVAFMVIFSIPAENIHRVTLLRYLFGLGFSLMAVYAMLLKMLQGKMIPDNYSIYNASFFTTDIAGKLKWFLQVPLKDVTNFWNIFPSTGIALLVMGFIILTHLFFIDRDFRYFASGRIKKEQVVERISRIICLFFLIPLSYAPNLLTVDNYPGYDSCVALATVVLLVLFGAIFEWISLLQESAKKKILLLILCLSCALGMFCAYYTVLNYRVIPSSLELQFIKDELKKVDLTRYQTIYFIIQEKPMVGPEFRYDEYVTLGTSISTNNTCTVKCALNELGAKAYLVPEEGSTVKFAKSDAEARKGQYHYLNIYHARKDDLSRIDPGVVVIDMNQLNRSVSNR